MIETKEMLEFDPHKDICEVSQTGFVDLVDAFENNTIAGDLMVDADKFNGIEDPNSILGSPRDNFEAAHYRETLAGYKAPSNNPSGGSDNVE